GDVVVFGKEVYPRATQVPRGELFDAPADTSPPLPRASTAAEKEIPMRRQIELVEDFKAGRMSRRDFVKRATAIGMTAPVTASIVMASPAMAGPAPRTPGLRTRAQGKPGGTFVFGAWQDPDTLDPHTTGLAATSRILIHIYDPLLWRNPADGKFYPGL